MAEFVMYLVWLHLKLDEQVLALVSSGVVFENHEATSMPAADVPFNFRSLAVCRRQTVESQIFLSFLFLFFAYVVFAEILIKIMHVRIIYIYVYMKVTRPHVHYRVITLWVSICSCC
jgi:hypothetical protein